MIVYKLYSSCSLILHCDKRKVVGLSIMYQSKKKKTEAKRKRKGKYYFILYQYLFNLVIVIYLFIVIFSFGSRDTFTFRTLIFVQDIYVDKKYFYSEELIQNSPHDVNALSYHTVYF